MAQIDYEITTFYKEILHLFLASGAPLPGAPPLQRKYYKLCYSYIMNWGPMQWYLLGPYNTSDYPIIIVFIPLINIFVPLFPPYCYYCAP